MERRRFLSTAALGASAIGSGAIWLPGCGAAIGARQALGAPGYRPIPPPVRAPGELTYTEEEGETPEGGRGDSELTVGSIVIGGGFAVFGIGGIISLAMQSIWPVVIAATPASIAVIVGIVFLIIGAAQNAQG